MRDSEPGSLIQGAGASATSGAGVCCAGVTTAGSTAVGVGDVRRCGQVLAGTFRLPASWPGRGFALTSGSARKGQGWGQKRHAHAQAESHRHDRWDRHPARLTRRLRRRDLPGPRGARGRVRARHLGALHPGARRRHGRRAPHPSRIVGRGRHLPGFQLGYTQAKGSPSPPQIPASRLPAVYPHTCAPVYWSTQGIGAYPTTAYIDGQASTTQGSGRTGSFELTIYSALTPPK
jgi:hypothetical protein